MLFTPVGCILLLFFCDKNFCNNEKGKEVNYFHLYVRMCQNHTCYKATNDVARSQGWLVQMVKRFKPASINHRNVTDSGVLRFVHTIQVAWACKSTPSPPPHMSG